MRNEGRNGENRNRRQLIERVIKDLAAVLGRGIIQKWPPDFLLY